MENNVNPIIEQFREKLFKTLEEKSLNIKALKEKIENAKNKED